MDWVCVGGGCCARLASTSSKEGVFQQTYSCSTYNGQAKATRPLPRTAHGPKIATARDIVHRLLCWSGLTAFPTFCLCPTVDNGDVTAFGVRGTQIATDGEVVTANVLAFGSPRIVFCFVFFVVIC